MVRDLAQKALSERQIDTVTAGVGTGCISTSFRLIPKLIICGAGHIGVPLVRFAREVGFKVTVLDDRADFAHPARFPGCYVGAALEIRGSRG